MLTAMELISSFKHWEEFTVHMQAKHNKNCNNNLHIKLLRRKSNYYNWKQESSKVAKRSRKRVFQKFSRLYSNEEVFPYNQWVMILLVFRYDLTITYFPFFYYLQDPDSSHTRVNFACSGAACTQPTCGLGVVAQAVHKKKQRYLFQR